LETTIGCIPVERAFGALSRDRIAEAINAWIADSG
jgi:hypothetical protein